MRLPVATGTFALLLGGCDGNARLSFGDGGLIGQGPPRSVDAAVGGIWEGTASDGSRILGLVSESGEFHFLDDGAQYFGTLASSGNVLSGNFTAATDLDTAFLDGATLGAGTLSGTVQARSVLTATLDFTTARGARSVLTVDLAFDAQYERDSSLATIAGNFLETATGQVLNVSAGGELFLQDPASGCVLNGTVLVIDARFGLYRVQYRYSDCLGERALLNGLSFRGLAALDDSFVPERLVIAAAATSAGEGFSLVDVLERS